MASTEGGEQSDDARSVHDALAAARLRAATDFPYYAHGLFSLVPVVEPGLGTVAIDRAWRLYVDPVVVDRWDVNELSAVLIHELHHLLRDHAGLADDLGIADEDRYRWNIAADCAINDDLITEQMALPGGPVTLARLGLADGELEETYFEALSGSPGPSLAAGFPRPGARGVTSGTGGPLTPDAEDRADTGRTCDGLVDQAPPVGCGSGADGRPRPWDVGEGDTPGLTAVEGELVRRHVAAEALAASKGRGAMPQGLVRWAKARLEAKLDWRRVLRGELRSARSWVTGTTHTSFSRADRRSDSRPDFVFPGTHRPAPEIAVVIDTSASMSSADLDQSLTELHQLLMETATHQVWVVSCDGAAYVPTRVDRVGGVTLVGGGGTDMRVGIRAAAALRPRPDVIVVFTDGGTPWPAAAPSGTRVVAVVIADHAKLPTGRGITSVRVPTGGAPTG